MKNRRSHLERIMGQTKTKTTTKATKTALTKTTKITARTSISQRKGLETRTYSTSQQGRDLVTIDRTPIPFS